MPWSATGRNPRVLKSKSRKQKHQDRSRDQESAGWNFVRKSFRRDGMSSAHRWSTGGSLARNGRRPYGLLCLHYGSACSSLQLEESLKWECLPIRYRQHIWCDNYDYRFTGASEFMSITLKRFVLYDYQHTYHSPSDYTASVSKTDQGEGVV